MEGAGIFAQITYTHIRVHNLLKEKKVSMESWRQSFKMRTCFTYYLYMKVMDVSGKGLVVERRIIPFRTFPQFFLHPYNA